MLTNIQIGDIFYNSTRGDYYTVIDVDEETGMYQRRLDRIMKLPEESILKTYFVGSIHTKNIIQDLEALANKDNSNWKHLRNVKLETLDILYRKNDG